MAVKNFKPFRMISDGKLDIEYFKSLLEDVEWKRTPRMLNQDVRDYWYIGELDMGTTIDEDVYTVFKFKVSPDKWMRVMETHVGEFIGNRGEKKNRSTSIEVRIGQNLIDKIQKLSTEYNKEKPQLVDL